MIAYLKGKVIWQVEDKVIIDVNDVGYQVYMPNTNLIENMSAELYIYTYVKEDKLDLYGFSTMEEKELFEILISVSGIGPKAAMNIISTLALESFVNAILTENVSTLKQISGIGPKTAQRLILELKNKVENLALGLDKEIKKLSNDQELYDALLSLGYSAREIESTLRKVEITDNMSIENKIKEVLSYIAKER
ncbi:Holliday junction branch migration protein RuvA [Natronospora cellulosivora (SeqCode)]